MPDTFPARLIALRQSRGLSVYALSQRSGLDQTALGRYERGEREPQACAIVTLADALGCTAGQLLGLEPLDDDGPAE